jgi:hypothetical protein
MRQEVLSSSSPSPELRPVASGGVFSESHADKTDLDIQREKEERSAAYKVAYDDAVRKSREYLAKEYPDGDLINPNEDYIVVTDRRGNKTGKNILTDEWRWVDDPAGTYMPHNRHVTLLGQDIQSNQGRILGRHWLEGKHYGVDAKGKINPLGEFILGSSGGIETVVNVDILERPDGAWVRSESLTPIDNVNGTTLVDLTALPA